eukprot:SAG22_NODE_459_length_10228_cov_9.593642_8_plen_200_part_00
MRQNPPNSYSGGAGGGDRRQQQRCGAYSHALGLRHHRLRLCLPLRARVCGGVVQASSQSHTRPAVGRCGGGGEGAGRETEQPLQSATLSSSLPSRLPPAFAGGPQRFELSVGFSPKIADSNCAEQVEEQPHRHRGRPLPILLILLCQQLRPFRIGHVRPDFTSPCVYILTRLTTQYNVNICTQYNVNICTPYNVNICNH